MGSLQLQMRDGALQWSLGCLAVIVTLILMVLPERLDYQLNAKLSPVLARRNVWLQNRVAAKTSLLKESSTATTVSSQSSHTLHYSIPERIARNRVCVGQNVSPHPWLFEYPETALECAIMIQSLPASRLCSHSYFHWVENGDHNCRCAPLNSTCEGNDTIHGEGTLWRFPRGGVLALAPSPPAPRLKGAWTVDKSWFRKKELDLENFGVADMDCSMGAHMTRPAQKAACLRDEGWRRDKNNSRFFFRHSTMQNIKFEFIVQLWFHRLGGRRVGLWGDSLTRQSLAALICFLSRDPDVVVLKLSDCDEPWNPTRADCHSYALSRRDARSATEKIIIRCLSYHKQPLRETPDAFSKFIDAHDVVVVNVGLHYIPGPEFVEILNAMLPVWKSKMLNASKILMWRETSTQHFVGGGLYEKDRTDEYKTLGCDALDQPAKDRMYRNNKIFPMEQFIRHKISLVEYNFVAGVTERTPNPTSYWIPFQDFAASRHALHIQGDCTHFCYTPGLWEPLIYAIASVMPDR